MFQATDLLQTLAEIAAAFIGFSGVVVVFLRSRDQGWKLSDRARFLGMISNAFGFLAFALIPFVPLSLGAEAVWQISSGLFFIFLVVNPIIMGRITAKALSGGDLNIVFVRVLGAGTFVSVLAALANTIGWPWKSGFTLYLVCLLWVLIASALNFFRLVYVGVSEGGEEAPRTD